MAEGREAKIKSEDDFSKVNYQQGASNLKAMKASIKQVLTSKKDAFEEQLNDNQKKYRFFLEPDVPNITFEVIDGKTSVSQIAAFVLSDAPAEEIDPIIEEIKADILKLLNADLSDGLTEYNNNPHQTNKTTTPNKVIKFFGQNSIKHVDLANVTPADYPVLAQALTSMITKQVVKDNLVKVNDDKKYVSEDAHISLSEVSFSHIRREGLSGGLSRVFKSFVSHILTKKEIALTVSADHAETAQQALQKILPDYKIYTTVLNSAPKQVHGYNSSK